MTYRPTDHLGDDFLVAYENDEPEVIQSQIVSWYDAIQQSIDKETAREDTHKIATSALIAAGDDQLIREAIEKLNQALSDRTA